MEPQAVRVTLRIPPDVHAQASAIARNGERSLNWQIVEWMRVGIAAQATPQDRKDRP